MFWLIAHFEKCTILVENCTTYNGQVTGAGSLYNKLSFLNFSKKNVCVSTESQSTQSLKANKNFTMY